MLHFVNIVSLHPGAHSSWRAYFSFCLPRAFRSIHLPICRRCQLCCWAEESAVRIATHSSRQQEARGCTTHFISLDKTPSLFFASFCTPLKWGHNRSSLWGGKMNSGKAISTHAGDVRLMLCL